LAESTVNHLLATSYGSFIQDDWKVMDRLTLNLGLRWEINKPPIDSAGRLSNFDPSLKQVVISSTSSLTGITITDPNQVITAAQAGLPESLVYTSYKDFAPRFGFAWRPFGGNRTVVRGGYGIFYGGNTQNAIRLFLADAFPFIVSQTVNRNATNPQVLTLANPFPTAANLSGSLATTAVGVYEIHPPAQYLQSWNLTVEREVGFSSALKISYVGSKGTHLGMQNNLNTPFDRSAKPPAGISPFPGWANMPYYALEANSSYNGLTVTWQRRYVHGFFFTANYTYSKSLDEASQFNGGSTGGIVGLQNIYCLRCDRGRSDWDVGHMFTPMFSWQAPYHNLLARGWQIAGTSRFYSGQPFTPVVTNSNLNLGEASRPDRIGKGTLPNPSPGMWFDVADFPLVPDGSFAFGNSGRNILDGPGRIEVNLSLDRNFLIRERNRIQFRWEVFNVLNHANFGIPANAVNASNAGTILSADTGRVMQFALRHSF
jgi:hypothetical protein